MSDITVVYKHLVITAPSLDLQLATSEMCCWSAGRTINKTVSVLHVTALCIIIMVHKDTSSSHR